MQQGIQIKRGWTENQKGPAQQPGQPEVDSSPTSDFQRWGQCPPSCHSWGKGATSLSYISCLFLWVDLILFVLDLRPAAGRNKASGLLGFQNVQASVCGWCCWCCWCRWRDGAAATSGVTLILLTRPPLLSTRGLGVGMGWRVPLAPQPSPGQQEHWAQRRGRTSLTAATGATLPVCR